MLWGRPHAQELLFFNGNYGSAQGQNCHPTADHLSAYMKTFEQPEVEHQARDAPTGAPLEIILGEFSATYFACECCPKAAKAFMPHMRPIVLLRDPVARVQSRFLAGSRRAHAMSARNPGVFDSIPVFETPCPL